MKRRVRLRSFDGTRTAPADVSVHEDYWRLIGTTGVVLRTERRFGAERALIEFDASVGELGLECHNENPNALWIRVTDLEVV